MKELQKKITELGNRMNYVREQIDKERGSIKTEQDETKEKLRALEEQHKSLQSLHNDLLSTMQEFESQPKQLLEAKTAIDNIKLQFPPKALQRAREMNKENEERLSV